jgi:hypothetical protein
VRIDFISNFLHEFLKPWDIGLDPRFTCFRCKRWPPAADYEAECRRRIRVSEAWPAGVSQCASNAL